MTLPSNHATMQRMPGNPKDSRWFSTPQSARKRKIVAITLSDEARALLEWLAEERHESKSEIVEGLIVKEGRARKR